MKDYINWNLSTIIVCEMFLRSKIYTIGYSPISSLSIDYNPMEGNQQREWKGKNHERIN